MTAADLYMYPFRVVSALPRDMLYGQSHGMFNTLDSLRSAEVSLRLMADDMAETHAGLSDAIRERLGRINAIADDVRPLVDTLIAARKAYQTILDELEAIIKEEDGDA